MIRCPKPLAIKYTYNIFDAVCFNVFLLQNEFRLTAITYGADKRRERQKDWRVII